jgi:7-cyano-7-deazaguanine synthase in queuosine biosynthesis
MAGLQAYKHRCTFVMTGRKQAGYSYRTDPENFRQEHVKHQELLHLNRYGNMQEAPTLVYPLWQWSDQQVKDYLGDLVQYTWSCRQPRDGQPCGICTPCQDYVGLK